MRLPVAAWSASLSAFLFASQLIASVEAAHAQEFDPEMMGIPPEMMLSEEGGEGEAAAAAAPTPRLQALQKLEFDRRPSSALAVWSTPPKQPDAEKEKAKQDEAAAAAKAEPPVPENETEEQKAARLAAAEAAKKAKEEAEKKAAEAKAIAAEMEALKRNVTLGRWDDVRAYYATLTEAEAKAGYLRMLQSLQQGPQQRPQVPQQGQMYIEKNRFSPDDVIGLARVFPKKLEKAQLAILGQLLKQSLDAGFQLEPFLAALEPRLAEEGFGVDKRLLSKLLVAASQPQAIGKLVPTLAEAEGANDREGLNLIARHLLALHAKDAKTDLLQEAWKATQAVLAVGEVEDETKKEALTRAVDLAPKLQKELGQAWLDESFTARPERGMEIVAAIGSSASLALAAQAMEEDRREKLLELQTTAAKALLAAAPELATSWSRELELLANNWLREAEVSYQYDESSSMSPRMQRDYYGNFYYYNWGGNYRGNVPNPIATGKLLELRPTDGWIALLSPTLVPRFQILFAQLYLKVGEEAKAFPYVESVANTLPRQGKELADEFLRVWTKNHDPNSERNRTNQYMFFYGFEERASGIPLTRSKQERNLEDLAGWVARLRKLPVELDDSLVAGAFTAAHSVAEVFRMEEIEKIFGSPKELKASTLATILQTMRANLVQVWRDPALQEKNKTGRRQKDIQAEVLRGYALGAATVDTLIEGHPDAWELWVVKAALAHDENNFRAELGKDPEFTARRNAAFDSFRKAGELYAANLPGIEQEKQGISAYDMWFYAALGACDLKAIDAKSGLATAEIAAIRNALASLPGEAAERHLGMFAAGLFTRMSNVAPAIKFRYVREGLSIVGDHKLAHEARQVFDYYKDLVTEIQLRARVDGSANVGKDEPFGLSIDIRHTKEIERESGGFGKYLQNQNSQNFGYNYGRPLEDYRDKFEETLRTTLAEHFEVLSVTFNDPQVRSKAEAEYGWRVTPYAYVLLKPRSEAIDRIPPIRLDLDFLDTTGYAVLPVESPAVVIDAKAGAAEPRPFERLALTQTLDERQSKSGKLLLEVKAGGVGLVPKLDLLLDLAPEGFDVASVDDHGVSVVKFAEEGSGVDSERTWTIALQAKPDLATPPTAFHFGKPKAEAVTSEHFRYVDADLATVGETVALESQYAKPDRTWMWWIPAAFLAMACGVFGWLRMQKPKASAEPRFRLPSDLNAFTVLGLLRDIQRNSPPSGGLATAAQRELAADIERIERHYFGEVTGESPDLERIARSWASRAQETAAA